jgi:Flp pilus assembly protein TadG
MRLLRPASPGQALVEFALVFPVLIVLLLGLFDLGRGVYAYNTVANAARDGARVAAVNQIQSSVAGDCVQSRPVESVAMAHWSIKSCAVASAIALGVPETDVSVAYSPPPTTPTLGCSSPLHVGCIASVTVRYQFRPLTPVIGNLMGPITMDSTSQIPVERVFP